MKQTFLPLAVWYTGGDARATLVYAPAPDREQAKARWQRDVQYIRACGFNAVRAWIDWASGEPEPGVYNFSTLDLLFEMAREAGLKVLVQVYLDSAPDWLPVLYPDSHYVASGGQKIVSQTAPGYCYDHPGVRQQAEAFLRRLAEYVNTQPNFYAWDLWSEPHVVQWAYFDYLPPRSSFCFCHYSRTRFRNWLKKKYGSLSALNEAWYRTYRSWDEVEPPRFISLMAYTDFMDWQEFIVDKIAADLAWRRQVVKSVNPDFITTSHSAVPGILTVPYTSEGEPDDWRMARAVDIWGTSFYPKHVGAKETNDPAVRGAYLDSTRSAADAEGKPFWLGELQGGHGYVGTFAIPADAKDERLWTWGPLAHGAKGLNWYAWRPMMRGIESAGFGLTNLDGTPSERALAAGAIARVVTREMELFLAARPVRAQAAVVYNLYANMLWVGLREVSAYVPSRSLLGAYRSLFENHHPADFLHIDLLAQGKVDGYKLIYLPFALAMPPEATAVLRRFVEDGGVVVAEARTGWNDPTGRCGTAVPGVGLNELFGAEEIGTYKVDSTMMKVVAHEIPAASSPGSSTGDRDEPAAASALRLPFPVGAGISGSLFEQHLRPYAGTQVLATFANGDAAITARRVGMGVAVLIGTMLSFTYQTRRDPAAGQLLAAFQDWAGLVRPVEVTGIGDDQHRVVEPRLLEAGEGRYLFFAFNHGEEEVEPVFRVRGLAPGRYAVDELVAEEGLVGPDGSGVLKPAPGEHWWQTQHMEVSAGRPELILSKKLAAGEVWVLKLVKE
ncbi:MAG: beta-galactosidase [Limnochordales bacterium]|nr:beta-galactosidase [Limnochordales bacterium]